MSNNKLESNIKCPFYQGMTRNIICCEGFMKNTCMTTRFPSPVSRTEHMRENCFLVDGGRCPMAKGLFEKYGMRSLTEALTGD